MVDPVVTGIQHPFLRSPKRRLDMYYEQLHADRTEDWNEKLHQLQESNVSINWIRIEKQNYLRARWCREHVLEMEKSTINIATDNVTDDWNLPGKIFIGTGVFYSTENALEFRWNCLQITIVYQIESPRLPLLSSNTWIDLNVS